MHLTYNFSTYFVRRQITRCCTEQQLTFVVVIIWKPSTLCGRNEIFMLFRKIAKNDNYLLHVCLSVRPHGKKTVPIGGIFTTFDI
jgi:hypothetical protein